MNPELLIAHFDRISGAPEAIPRLRRFILDLAVRGKLVDQKSDDGSALTLLDTQRPRALPGLRTEQRTESVANGRVPFEIPSNWIWVPLGSVCSKTGSGSTPRGGKSVYQRDGVPFLRSQNVYDDGLRLDDVAYIDHQTHERMSGTAVQPRDLLLNITGGSIGRCCSVPSELGLANISQHVAIIRVAIDGIESYLHKVILSPYFQSFILSEQTGAGRGGLPKNRMDRIPVALPPLAEQHRIVAKINELMVLCDRLEALRREREAQRKQLTATSHHHLNHGADVNPVRQQTSFFIANLSHLTVRPYQIKQLRQTILNMAVRGQLVRQDAGDEPAIEIIKRIEAERAKLPRGRITKNLDAIAPPKQSESPLPMPLGWTLASLQALCISVTDGDHLPPPKTDEGIPFLVIGNVRNGAVDFTGCRHVSKQYYEALDNIRRPKKGDILYTLVGSYGIPVMLADDRTFCVQRHIGILRPAQPINAKFLSHILASDWVFDQATACATGIAQKTVPLSGLRKIQIPLPPIREQQRIVARVDQLMLLCEQLEGQLTTAQAEAARLLESVLHHALNDGPTEVPTQQLVTA